MGYVAGYIAPGSNPKGCYYVVQKLITPADVLAAEKAIDMLQKHFDLGYKIKERLNFTRQAFSQVLIGTYMFAEAYPFYPEAKERKNTLKKERGGSWRVVKAKKRNPAECFSPRNCEVVPW